MCSNFNVAPPDEPQNPHQFVAQNLARYGLDLYEQESLMGANHHSVNGQPVVIRVARQQVKRCSWQWTVNDLPKNAFLVLVAVTNDGYHAYVLPPNVATFSTRFETRTHPRQNAGWMAPYLNNWSQLVSVTEVV